MLKIKCLLKIIEERSLINSSLCKLTAQMDWWSRQAVRAVSPVDKKRVEDERVRSTLSSARDAKW